MHIQQIKIINKIPNRLYQKFINNPSLTSLEVPRPKNLNIFNKIQKVQKYWKESKDKWNQIVSDINTELGLNRLSLQQRRKLELLNNQK